MINLLPPYEKQELKLAGVQVKLSIIFVYFLCCLALLTIIFFFLNYYIVLQIDEFDVVVTAKTQELDSYQFQDFKEATTKVNQKLVMINLFQQDEILISPFFAEIISLAGDGIAFSVVSLTKNTRLVQKEEPGEVFNETYSRVNLLGTATTREVLYAFKQVLENQKHFRNIYFAPNSWTESQNAAFSVSFEIVY